MATIKSLLSTALESFLTSKKSWTGQQAFPTGSAVNLTPTYSNGKYVVTAPSDGLLVINCYRASGATTMTLYGTGWGWGQADVSCWYSSVSTTVKKGDMVNFDTGNIDTSRTYVQFFKTVGSS